MTDPWAFPEECVEGDPDCGCRGCPIHWCDGCDRPGLYCECP